MTIIVTKTVPGAPDGVHTQLYVAGITYDMPDDLGAVFVREGWGAVCEPTEPTEPTEPIKPIAPTEPAEPAEPTEPTEPIEPTKTKKAKGPKENK